MKSLVFLNTELTKMLAELRLRVKNIHMTGLAKMQYTVPKMFGETFDGRKL